MKKCPKTVSGKHFWEEFVFSWEAVRSNALAPKRTYRKCLACGLIDDRKK